MCGTIRTWLAVAALAASSCQGGGGYDVTVHFRRPADAQAAVRVEVALVSSCDPQVLGQPATEVVTAVDVRRMQAPAPLGAVIPGSYGLYGRAISNDCRVVAAGCAPVSVVAGGSGELSVTLDGITGSACGAGEACVAGVCGAAADGGADSGTPIDGGTDSGTAVDAGLDSTACDDVYASAVFCDGFEDGPLPGRWTNTGASEAGNTTARDGAQVYRGANALHLHVTSTADGTWTSIWKDDLFDGRTTGDIYVRMYIYVPATPGVDGSVDFLKLEPSSRTMGTYLSFEPDQSLEMDIIPNGDPCCPHSTGRPVPIGRWFCFELHENLATSRTGRAEAFLDGAPWATLDPAITSPSGGYRHLTLQALLSGQTTPFDMFVDEVVASYSPIGCD